MDEIDQLPDYFAGMLEGLSDEKKAQFAMQVAREIRKNQSKRITRQQNPDGSAYVPRRTRRRKLKNKKMFRKLKTTKYMKLEKTSGGSSIGYSGFIAYIAQIHQTGGTRTIRTKHGSIKMYYAQRILLGFTPEEIAMVEDQMIDFLADLEVKE